MNELLDTIKIVASVQDELEIDYAEWRKKKPDGVSACIRVRNESQFMRAAVRSVVDLVDEVVLVVQPSEDNTREIAIALEQEYPNVRAYYYPLIPDWIDTKGFYEKDPNKPGHLVHMSNWALSKCSYSWILKIEGDVIALPTLAGFIRLVRNNMDIPHYYGLVILNLAGRNMDKFSRENPRNGGGDEAIFPNNPDKVKFERRGKWEVAVPSIPQSCLGWALVHLKRCKTGKDEGWNGEHYEPLDKDILAHYLKIYNDTHGGYPGADNLPYGHLSLFTGEWKSFLK